MIKEYLQTMPTYVKIILGGFMLILISLVFIPFSSVSNYPVAESVDICKFNSDSLGCYACNHQNEDEDYQIICDFCTENPQLTVKPASNDKKYVGGGNASFCSSANSIQAHFEEESTERQDEDLKPTDETIYTRIMEKLQQGFKIEVQEYASTGDFHTQTYKYRIPEYLDSSQFIYFYKLDDLTFVLYKKRNMNYGGTGLYSGILYAETNSETWQPFFAVQDIEGSNNPYYFGNDGTEINIFVVDTNGAGSGEGDGKLLSSKDGGMSWSNIGCAYYLPEVIFDQTFTGQEVFDAVIEFSEEDEGNSFCNNILLD